MHERFVSKRQRMAASGERQTAPATSQRRPASACWLPIALLAACGDDADPSTPPPLGVEEQAEIQQAVARSLGAGLATSYSVAVWRDGAVIYSEAFGAAAEDGSPATPDTLFQIGSDTKKITALALLQQVEAGALDLDAPLEVALPELQLANAPGYTASVSVHELLQHRSGLYDYTPWTDAPDDAGLAAITLQRFADNEYLVTPPAIAWQYSNPNYSLAGLIVERLAGRPWADVVSERVFAPLDLQHSYGRRDDALDAGEHLASGHGNVSPGTESFALLDTFDSALGWLAPEAQPDNAFVRPAGMVWSTAADQARLLGFLADGDPAVLSDISRRSMLAPHPSIGPHDVGLGYDYGLFVASGWGDAEGQYHTMPTVVHGGNTQTMTSGSILLPEQRLAVSVLANGAAEALDVLLARILTVAGRDRLPAPSAPPAPQPPAAELAAYAGDFSEPNLGNVSIAWRAGALEIAVPALDELEVPYDRALTPVALDIFLWSVAGTSIPLSFYDGADGSPHTYVTGEQIALTRLPAGVAP
jgi:CubicO group peptidase (beta-lactamase class C family)